MNQPLMAVSELMTPAQTAEFLKIKPRTLRKLTRHGLLPAIKLTGKIVRFRRVDVDSALERLVVGGNR